MELNPNLQSAWLSISNGTRDDSANATVCSIDVGPLFTHIAVCDNLCIIDTACVELGWDAIRYSPQRQVTFISDGAETFLDAVAKRIFVGTVVEEKMQWLLGELIAETIANLVFRPKPPQVSQRLACTEPLGRDYKVQRCIISGKIIEAIAAQQQEQQRQKAPCNLLPFLAAGLTGALRDREIGYSCGPSHAGTTPTGFSEQDVELKLPFANWQLDLRKFTDAPVLALGQARQDSPPIKLLARIDEWRRRFDQPSPAPPVIAAPDNVWKQIALSEIPDGSLPVVVPEARFDYLTAISASATSIKAKTKTIMFDQ